MWKAARLRTGLEQACFFFLSAESGVLGGFVGDKGDRSVSEIAAPGADGRAPAQPLGQNKYTNESVWPTTGQRCKPADPPPNDKGGKFLQFFELPLLSCSSDGWVKLSVCGPDEGSMEDALSQKFQNFMSFAMQLTFKSSLCCISCHTHIQSRTASWDSSGSEEISRPGLRCCEPSGFRGDAWVCEFQSTQNCMNASAVPSSGYGGAARLSVFMLWVQERGVLGQQCHELFCIQFPTGLRCVWLAPSCPP